PQPELAQEDVTDPLDLLYWPDGPGREGARVPVPWDDEAPNMGFTTGTPWLPIGWDIDAETRAETQASYVDLIALRSAHGWATARVAACETAEGAVTLTLETEDGARYEGRFATGAGGVGAVDDDLFAQPETQDGWGASIRRA
ncbi:MAG: hypothetical protein ACU0CO_14585, partial [Shimia sp.]